MAGRLERSKTLEINGSSYRIDPHPATQALSIVRKLGAQLSFNVDDPMASITAICANSIKDDPTLELPLSILKHTQVNGDSITRDVFDEHYAANYVELFQAIKEVVEVNNFLQIGGLISSLNAD
jgi:hypothetical protein